MSYLCFGYPFNFIIGIIFNICTLLQHYILKGLDFFTMFSAGTITHGLDKRVSSGGFIHGFRYTARTLAWVLAARNHGKRCVVWLAWLQVCCVVTMVPCLLCG